MHCKILSIKRAISYVILMICNMIARSLLRCKTTANISNFRIKIVVLYTFWLDILFYSVNIFPMFNLCKQTIFADKGARPLVN